MRVSRLNTAFYRDVNEKYEAGEHEYCPICGRPIYWPYEAVDLDGNDVMCHLSRATVGKEELGHEPSTDFKKRILIAEHSPIRCIQVEWTWENIPSWVATHWSRHRWECFIKTQRSDRTGVDRNKLPQDAPVTFTGIANTQNLIDTWRKRLCYQAAPEAREYAEDFKIALHEFEPEISDVLVPNCVYRGGMCPEMKKCGFCEKFIDKSDIHSINGISDLYDYYNKWFWKRKGGK